MVRTFFKKNEKKLIFFTLTPCFYSWKFYNWSHPRTGHPKRPERETKARETFGKIEGIGDVLSDGPRKFLGSQINQEARVAAKLAWTWPSRRLKRYLWYRHLRKTGQTILKINEEFDPGSERTLVACLIHASRARQRCRAANGWVTRKQSAPYQEIPVPTRG